MFFRTKKSPSGTVTQLVESFRNDEGQARQSIILSLGQAKINEDIRRDVAKVVETRLYHEPELLERPLTLEAAYWVDRIVNTVQHNGTWTPGRKRRAHQDNTSSEAIDGVLSDKIDHTHSTTLGPELLALHAWKQLNMPGLLETLGFNQAQCDAAAVSVVNRLVAPCSEHFMQTWLTTSSLSDLLGSDILNFADDRYYRISDKLLAAKDKIEAHLRHAQKARFNLQRTIILYDLTNTHFEGVCRHNPKAKRGKNKQKRNDCPQVVVGMVFDEFGFELAHQTFSGNTQDSTTLAFLVNTLKKLTDSDQELADAKPIVVVDAGIATKDNLRRLREEGFSYLVNASRQQREVYADHFRDDSGFEAVPGREKNGRARAPVLVKAIDHTFTEEASDDPSEASDSENAPETITERLVLCKSDTRGDKERAMISKAEEKLLERLQKLATRIAKGQIKKVSKIHEAIGRLRSNNSRVVRFYDIDFQAAKKPAKGEPSGVLHYTRKDQLFADSQLVMGCYVLRTDQQDLPAEQLWQLYITLVLAEEGFRLLKTDLGLRPNFHQIEDRVDGHIFITVLAYHVLTHILYTLRQRGDTRGWHTVRCVLQPHSYATLIVPTVDGTVHRIRKPGLPEASQAQIYRHFDIDTTALPQSKVIITPK